MKNRAGTFIMQPSGYSSFVPHKLPPEPPLQYDAEILTLLSNADRKLGRLDGITQTLPNPELFVAMYVQKEAVLSSQIEGTQASLSDVLEQDNAPEKRGDVSEVVNYVNAMNYGLKRLHDFPLSLRLIREIHAKLLENGRGSTRNPGEFRSTQNWIGPQGCTLQEATFIPPCIPDMKQALADLEIFLHGEDTLPALIRIALIHAQFESIHPFLDGNGRMGRLLITFWLCQQEILSEPLLYLSYYFKKNRLEYYDRLMAVRTNGDWEGWVKFFLKGIPFVSDEATETAKEILTLKNKFERILLTKNNTNYTKLFEQLFQSPFTTKTLVQQQLNTTYPTASKIIDDFCSLNILDDITPTSKRNKRYAFSSYINILNRGTELQ